MHLNHEELGITESEARHLERTLGPLSDDPGWRGRIVIKGHVVLDRMPPMVESDVPMEVMLPLPKSESEKKPLWRWFLEYVTNPMVLTRIPIYALAVYAASRLHYSGWTYVLFICGSTTAILMDRQDAYGKWRRKRK